MAGTQDLCGKTVITAPCKREHIINNAEILEQILSEFCAMPNTFSVLNEDVDDLGGGVFEIPDIENPADGSMAITETLKVYEYDGTDWVLKVANVVLSATGADGIEVDSSDPNNIIIKLTQGVLDSLALADSALQPGDNVSLLMNNKGYLSSVQDIATLRTTVSGDEKVYVEGYYSDTPGSGGGNFWWDSTSTETDNGGTIIKVTSVATGRWKRVEKSHVNVDWFGAKPDGVTDSTIAIQQAQDNHAVICFSDGEYVIDSINVSSNRKFYSLGGTTLKLIHTPTAPMFNLIGSVGSELKDVEFYNLKFTHRTDFSRIDEIGSFIFFDKVVFSKISNCIFESFSGKAIYALDLGLNGNEAASISIRECTFRNSNVPSASGIYASNGAEYISIENNRFFSVYKGIEFIDSANHKITSNYFTTCAYGIYAGQGNTGANFGKFIINSNTFNHQGSYGVYIFSLNFSESSNLITGNNFFLNYNTAIYLSGTYKTVVSSNNIVAGGLNKAIELEESSLNYKGDNNLITGNSITGTIIDNMTLGGNTIVNNILA